MATAPTVKRTESPSWPITRAFLKVLIPDPGRRSPFNTFAGLNADSTNAGYNPATAPTAMADAAITARNGMLVHGIVRLRSARLLNVGRNNQASSNAAMNPAVETTSDS